MSYFGDNEVMGGIGVGDDQYGDFYSYDAYTDLSVYGYGQPLDPYLPIENEPMGNHYSPDNFNSSNPKVKSNYKYNPLSTYNLDTDAIYSNHMRGPLNARWRAADARYPPFEVNPNRNSFNVERDYIQNAVNYQAPNNSAKSGAKEGFASGNAGNAGNSENSGKKEKMCGCAMCSVRRKDPHGHSLTLFLVFLIIVLVIFAYTQMKQNKEMIKMIKSMFPHHGFMPKI
jgi:hypothetical protein